MYKESKKLIYIKIFIVAVCLLFIVFIIFLVNNIQQSFKIDDVIVEETTVEGKMVFDLTIPPKDQRKIISEHRVEYLRQLYDDIFQDYKFSNCIELFTYGQLVDNFKSVDTLKKLIKGMKYKSIFKILFMYNDKSIYKDLLISYPLNLDDLPVTENYKEKHPKPLYEEFDFIKKENYKHPKVYHGDYMDYWYDFFYTYGIGVNEEKKEICVGEEKDVSKIFIEDDDGIERLAVARDKDGNEILPIETRNIYFKYTTDEKGYVDDIIYDRTEIITDDKYIDNIIKYE